MDISQLQSYFWKLNQSLQMLAIAIIRTFIRSGEKSLTFRTNSEFAVGLEMKTATSLWFAGDAFVIDQFQSALSPNQTPNWLQCTERNWKNVPSSDKHLIQIEFGFDSKLVPIFNSLSSHCSFNWMVHCFSAFCWIYGACARIHRLLLEIAIVESSH